MCTSQAAIEAGYLGQGIGKSLLRLLADQLRDPFDHLVSGIAKENAYATKAHTKSGWKIIMERQDKYLVILSLRH